MKLGAARRFLGPRVAYSLMRVQANPTAEDIRVFEDICITLRTSNGTFRTTFRNRFQDVDAASIRLIRQFPGGVTDLRVQDRAVSTGLTSVEWFNTLREQFPNVSLEASDLLVELNELSSAGGETWIVEPNGTPLQYIRPPFVVSVYHPESWRNPFLRGISAIARRRFAQHSHADYTTRRIACIHPEAQQLIHANTGFRFVVRSVFDSTPGACDVMRTMNVLNRSYFPEQRLTEACAAIFDSLRPGGIWIVGRTLEEDLSNHATFLLRTEAGWQLMERIGNGSEIEELALRWRPAA